MSKKHFEILAAEIRQITGNAAREQAARAVARACARINPCFDMARFLAACNAL